MKISAMILNGLALLLTLAVIWNSLMAGKFHGFDFVTVALAIMGLVSLSMRGWSSWVLNGAWCLWLCFLGYSNLVLFNRLDADMARGIACIYFLGASLNFGAVILMAQRGKVPESKVRG